MIDEVLEREDAIVDSGIATDQEVENIVSRLEALAIDDIDKSDEERMELIDNADVSEIPQEINQGTGLFREEDPNGVVPLNNLEDINDPGIEIEEVVYEDRVRPEVNSVVNVDNMINEEVYDSDAYGEPADSGISGDISGRVEEVEEEEEKCYAGEDAYCDEDTEEEESPVENDIDGDEIVEEEEDDNVGRIADDINKASAYESEEDEVVEVPEELEEKEEEVVEEAEDTEGEDSEVVPEEETVEEVEEEVSEEPVEEEPVESEDGEVSEIVADAEADEAIAEGEEDVTGEVELVDIYAGSVNDDLTGELREEVEAIELVDNANTKMFDEVGFMKDPEPEVKMGSDLETAGALADAVVDGVGVQETYTGEDIAETGSEEETVTSTEDAIPGSEEAAREEELETVAATESLKNFDSSRKFSARNVFSKFWNK